MSSSTPLIIIDFDETLYKKDSLITFCKYVYRKHPLQIWALIPQILSTILYFGKLIHTNKYKEIFLLFLYGLNEEKVYQLAISFWNQVNPNQFNASILNKVGSKGYRVICISASPELYLKPIMNTLKIEYIGTILHYKNNRYSIVGENCKGFEKVVRLKKYLNVEELEITESYSDSDTDRPLFDISKKAYKVNKLGELTQI